LEFHQVTAETNVTTTILMARRATRELTLSSYFSKDEPLLALPLGTVRLDELNADLETNGMGVVRLKTPMPGFARLDVSYQDERSIDSAPGPEDRDLPVSEKLVLDRLAAELGLAGMAPEDRLRAVSRFFLENFQYSTWLGSEQRAASNQTALARFLLQTRTGHCEYFATATTLLLRAANIPARYAVGFSVQERKGDHWVVRDRHAHAWCLAWVNGGWHDVDNTPGGWVGVEDARASWWDNVEDAWSNVWYYFSRWRWSNNDWKQYLIWLLAPLIGLTTWRLMARKEWRRSRRGGSAAADQFLRPGLDSEFYLIEQRLSALGLERQPGETLSAWLQRLMHDGLSHALPVQELLAMHQRLRFDPKGITPDERIQLRSQVTTWLQSELVRAQERGRVRGGRP